MRITRHAERGRRLRLLALLLPIGVLTIAAPSLGREEEPAVRLVATRDLILGAGESVDLPLTVVYNLPVETLTLTAYSVPLTGAPSTGRRELAAIELPGGDPGSGEIAIALPGLEPGTYDIELVAFGESAGGPVAELLIRRAEVTPNEVRLVALDLWELEQAEWRRQLYEEHEARGDGSESARMLWPPLDEVDLEAEEILPAEPEAAVLPRPAPLEPELREYVIDRSGDAWRKRDPITVRGRVVFRVQKGDWPLAANGGLQPLQAATVRVYDDDYGIDEHLGTTLTDNAGRWSLSVNGDDGWLQDGRDIYYTVELANSRVKVGICSWGVTYVFRWTSASRDHTPDGSTVDFGTQSPLTSPRAPPLFHRMLQMWRFVSGAGGQDPGYGSLCVDGLYSGAFYESALDRIHLPPARMGRFDSVGHEYGHFVMDMAYGPDPSLGGPHRADDCQQGEGLAWSEGWATGFSAIFKRTQNEAPSHNRRSVEVLSLPCEDGPRNESRIAAAVLDLWDETNDACPSPDAPQPPRARGRPSNHLYTYCDLNEKNRVAFRTIYNGTMWGNYHGTVSLFFSALRANLPAAARYPASQAFQWNWMPRVITGSGCVATSVLAREHEEGDALLSDLRAFRNEVLRSGASGRELARIYYRNSPEMAWLLLHNPHLLGPARVVAEHAAAVGRGIARDGERSELLSGPVLPPEVAGAVAEMLGGLRQSASPDLAADLETVERLLAQLGDRSWLETISVIEEIDRLRPDEAPASGKLDVSPRGQEILDSGELDGLFAEEAEREEAELAGPG